ncbi:MAG: 6-carboxytetrahydropterin synthase [Pseudomonadota bacterium]|nr:6-carboxytetrahydropterin synthase [Pseudomonadota bacterium]
MLTVTIKNQFESAVKLYGYEGDCANIHGHTYQVSVSFYNIDTKADMVVDYYEAKTWVEKAIAPLDHRFINEVKPFDKRNPTTENIAKWLFEQINKLTTKDVNISDVTLSENNAFSVKYAPDLKNT